VPAEAFAKFLYARDISNFNPRAPPSTAYQRHQKIINFSSVTAFVESSLRKGQFAEAETIIGVLELNIVPAEDAAESPMELPLLKIKVYEAYVVFCNERGIGRKAVDMAFWKKVRTLIPGLTEQRHRSAGRKRVIHFPSLKEARDSFQAAIHETSWDWEETGDDVLD
jgi:hypothetical protein